MSTNNEGKGFLVETKNNVTNAASTLIIAGTENSAPGGIAIVGAPCLSVATHKGVTMLADVAEFGAAVTVSAAVQPEELEIAGANAEGQE